MSSAGAAGRLRCHAPRPRSTRRLVVAAATVAVVTALGACSAEGGGRIAEGGTSEEYRALQEVVKAAADASARGEQVAIAPEDLPEGVEEADIRRAIEAYSRRCQGVAVPEVAPVFGFLPIDVTVGPTLELVRGDTRETVCIFEPAAGGTPLAMYSLLHLTSADEAAAALDRALAGGGETVDRLGGRAVRDRHGRLWLARDVVAVRIDLPLALRSEQQEELAKIIIEALAAR